VTDTTYHIEFRPWIAIDPAADQGLTPEYLSQEMSYSGDENGELTPMEMVGRLHASMVTRIQDYMVEVDKKLASKDRKIKQVFQSVQ